MGSCFSNRLICHCYCNNRNRNRNRSSNSSNNHNNNNNNSTISNNNLSSITTSEQQNQQISSEQNYLDLVINDSISLNNVPTGRNKRLKKDKYKWKSDVSINELELCAKRDEFWDTAPAFGGRVEIWNALKAICNAIDTNQNYEHAQAIIDSAQIILPNGTLNNCYDELGNHYQIPNYVITKPINLIKSSKTNITNTSTSTTNNNNNNNNSFTVESAVDTQLQVAQQINIENSTTTSSSSTTNNNNNNNNSFKSDIQLKFRLSNSYTNNDLKIIVNRNQTIDDIKKKIYELKQIEPFRQRMYFGGKLLIDRLKIKDIKLEKNYVIQVIIREDSPPKPQQQQQQQKIS